MMTRNRRVVAGAVLLAGSLSLVPGPANARTSPVSAGSYCSPVGQHPVLDGDINPSSAPVASQVTELRALEAVAMAERDFQGVQGLEIQLAPLIHRLTGVPYQPRW
jgi:hypothetical protein